MLRSQPISLAWVLAPALAMSSHAGEALAGAAGLGEARHALGVSLATGGRSQRDEVFNATRYAGPAGWLTLSYRHMGSRGRHDATIGGGAGHGWNRYDQPILWVDLDVRYAYQHLIAERAVRVWFGGSVGGGPGIYQFRYEDSDHIYWATLYDLATRLLLDRGVRGRHGRLHVLEAELEFPLLGVVSRPPLHVTYNNDKPGFGYLMRRAHHAPGFASFHNVQALRATAGWRLRLSTRVEGRLSYALEYVRVAGPAPVAVWTHTVGYRVNFLLGR